MTDEIFAFKMKLNPGQLAEYKQRHDKIWPELSEALKRAGVCDYSIHFDEETNILFATIWRSKTHGLAQLAKTELMQKWWSHMAGIMETHPDNEPVATPLETVFQLE